MGYQVLARKYRPQRFADVAGQDHVTVTLMNALTQGRIAHGYIFSGHRGIGKTTIARILAMALNCHHAIGSPERPTAEPCQACDSCTEIRAGNAVDVIEIDAATNRGIDEIRELRDAARYRPARDKYKIYILDEAHQITDAAFNALLKTLEEPPEHIVFMMATTQPEDIPQTVRSRCQHYSFHAVKLVDILGELRAIADQESVQADDAALSLLAEAGDGSMRDALSIMDQAIASAPLEDGQPRLDAAQIRELMGTVPNAVFEKILEAVDGNRSAEVMTVANQLLNAGNSPAQLARQLVRYLRNCVVAKVAGIGPNGEGLDGAATDLLQISADEQRRAARSAALFTEEELARFLNVMLRTFDDLGYRQEQRFHFELGLLKLVHLRRLLPVEEVLSQLPSSGGSGQPRPRPAAVTQAVAPTAPLRTSAPAPAPLRTTAPAVAFASPEKPSFSPFQADHSRKTPEVAPSTSTTAAVKTEPLPAPKPPAIVAARESVPQSTAPAVAVVEAAPATTASPSVPQSAEDLQRLATEALANAASQSSAADALAEAEWTVENGEIRVQTELSKTLLPMVINPEADKIVRAALRTAGAGALKLVLLPGAASASASAAKKPKPARTGSVQAKAMEHPIVQQAQKLFDAEIRNVIDLRDNN